VGGRGRPSPASRLPQETQQVTGGVRCSGWRASGVGRRASNKGQQRPYPHLVRLLIAGSSGLIGTALTASLERDGIEVRRLTRPESRVPGIPWDPASGKIPADALDGVDAVVNLAGRGIGEKRWSEGENRLLMESRTAPTRLLAEAVAARPQAQVLLNASAIGFYGDGGDRILDEGASPGRGPLAELCVAWEAATAAAAQAGSRVVLLRSGIVLSTAGGALGRLLAPFGPRWLSPYRWGLGGVVGRGTQYWSWITLHDEVRAIRHLLSSSLAGPVNLVSPNPVTHREFVKALGRALHRPTVMPIPRFVLRLVLGGALADALVLDGQRVVPSRLRSDGFRWNDIDLDAALGAALARP